MKNFENIAKYAGRIAEMSMQSQYIRYVTNRLNTVRNTVKAMIDKHIMSPCPSSNDIYNVVATVNKLSISTPNVNSVKPFMYYLDKIETITNSKKKCINIHSDKQLFYLHQGRFDLSLVRLKNCTKQQRTKNSVTQQF